jgi:antitoxin VapB
MALNIKHPDADRLARALSTKTGESLTDAVIQALRERLDREEARRRGPALRREIEAIRKRCASLPVLDSRSPEEIVGYDDRGLPR